MRFLPGPRVIHSSRREYPGWRCYCFSPKWYPKWEPHRAPNLFVLFDGPTTRGRFCPRRARAAPPPPTKTPLSPRVSRVVPPRGVCQAPRLLARPRFLSPCVLLCQQSRRTPGRTRRATAASPAVPQSLRRRDPRLHAPRRRPNAPCSAARARAHQPRPRIRRKPVSPTACGRRCTTATLAPNPPRRRAKPPFPSSPPLSCLFPIFSTSPASPCNSQARLRCGPCARCAAPTRPFRSSHSTFVPSSPGVFGAPARVHPAATRRALVPVATAPRRVRTGPPFPARF
mmetsp:Transcript_2035/g.7857  ORF Transcript_2035/g.7857 Transcript_2035/m.7857 type:complete len:285 (-) Transcript_2035:1371-2225(-)